MDSNEQRLQVGSDVDQPGEQQQKRQQHPQTRSPLHLSQPSFGSAVNLPTMTTKDDNRSLDDTLREISSRVHLLRSQIRQYEPYVEKLSQQLVEAKGTPQEMELLENYKTAAKELKRKKRHLTHAKDEAQEIQKQISIVKEEEELRQHVQQRPLPSPFRSANIPISPNSMFPTVSDPPPHESQDEATKRTIKLLQYQIFQYESLVQNLSPQVLAAKGTPEEPRLRARHTDALIEVANRRARLLELTGSGAVQNDTPAIPPAMSSNTPPITMNERMSRIESLRTEIRQLKSLAQTLYHQRRAATGTQAEPGLSARLKGAIDSMTIKQNYLDKLVAEVEEIRKLPTQTQLHLYRSHLQHQLGRYGIKASSIQPSPSLGPPTRLRLHQGPDEAVYDFILLPRSLSQPAIVAQQNGSMNNSQLLGGVQQRSNRNADNFEGEAKN